MPETRQSSRWKDDRPPSIKKFMESFADDYACAAHLATHRWPKGFVCPHCGSTRAWRLETKPWVWECAGRVPDQRRPGKDRRCGKQTSLIAGTAMHGTHLPLRTWFIAAYLMATHSNSISALQLQSKIGVTYKTAWLLLHKLRRCMVDPDRKPLYGLVEVDETSIGLRTKSDPVTGGQGKSTVGKRFIIGAVEKRGPRKSGRLRLAPLPENNACQTASKSGSDAISLIYGVPSRRASSKSIFPRPYICRLTSFSFVIWPSACPFDQGDDMAARTAASSFRTPRPNDETRPDSAVSIHAARKSEPTFRRIASWKVSMTDLASTSSGTPFSMAATVIVSDLVR